jgi:hypothetical protein
MSKLFSRTLPLHSGFCGPGLQPRQKARTRNGALALEAGYLLVSLFSLLFLSFTILSSTARAQRPEKDYLSSIEADKIRDAETPSARVTLFISFAEDRLKKFQYELDHPSANKHSEILNFFMNSYIGCLDDAADIITISIEKQDSIREGIDLMEVKAKEFLVILEKLNAQGPEKEIYKANLEDAIEGTQDAIHDAEKQKKKAAPPPVRRKN